MISHIHPTMMSRHLASLTVFGLSLLPCLAQDTENVSLQFLSFPKAIDPAPVELHVGEGKTIKVEIPTNELSAVYKVKRQATWTVGETVAGKEGKPEFKMLGQGKAPASSEQLLLLIRKGKTNSEGFDVIPIANRGTQFGGGKLLFMNAAGIDVAGVVGSEKFLIKPGQHSIIQPKAESKDSKLCRTELFFNKDGQAKPFFTSTWPVSDDARGLIFFYHDSATKRLRLHTIRDFPGS